MIENNKLRTKGMILLVLALVFALFASHQIIFEVFPQTNIITGFALLEGGFENSVIENSTQEILEHITEEETIFDINATPENVTIPEIILINETVENITKSEIELINKTAKARDKKTIDAQKSKISGTPLGKKKKYSKKEMPAVLDAAIDYYCEEKSMFLTKCLVQTEKELCSIEGNEIVCSPVENAQNYTNKLNSAEKKEFEEKGIPIYTGEYEIKEINGKNVSTEKIQYFKPAAGLRYEIDLDSIDNIHIGYTSDNFNITDFYWGTCDIGDNCTIDVGVEISPFDSKVTLPQISNLTGRWDFVEDAEDTANGVNNGTVSGATHTYERYYFDGTDDIITLSRLNLSDGDSFTVSAWVNFDAAGSANTIISEGLVTALATDGFHFYKNTVNVLYFTVGNGTSGVGGDADYDLDNLGTFAGNWYHVVGTFNNTDNKSRLYLNSELKDTSAGLAGGYSTYTNLPPQIGRLDYAASWYHKGSIENVYIWNTTLTQSEISNLYNQTIFNTSGNTVQYKGTFTGGVLDTNQTTTEWGDITWGSTEPTQTSIAMRYRLANFTKIDTTDSALVSYWNMNRSDATDIMANSSLDTNQVLDMKFNNATDFYDYSGQGNDGTNSGSAYTQEGYIRGARVFDGSNDIITLTKLNLTDGDSFTVSAWVKFAKAGSVSTIISEGVSTALATDGFHFYKSAANAVTFTVGNGTSGVGGDADYDLDNLGTFAGNWYHIVGTFNNTDNKSRLYLNSDLKDTSAGLAGGYSTYTTQPPQIGRLAYAAAWYHKGLIDNVRVYNTSLNAAQVEELYAKETGTYDSVGSNQGYANGTGRAGGIFEEDGALTFDGVNNYIDIGSINLGTNNLTMIVWAKKFSTGGHQTLANVNGNDFRTVVLNTGILEGYYDGTACTSTFDTDSYLNEWNMYAITFNGTNVTIYFNGDSKKVCADTPGAVTGQSYIGFFNPALGQYFNGTEDSIAIYNRSLTPTEINNLYLNWSGWSAYDSTSPMTVNEYSQALQYQALLNTTNNSITPTLNWVDLEYEIAAPVVTLVYPADDRTLAGRNVDFRCSATTIITGDLVNATLSIWNSTTDLIWNNTQTTSGTSISQNWTHILPYEDTYNWSCEVYDNLGRRNTSIDNFTFTVAYPQANFYQNATLEINTTGIFTQIKPEDSLIQLPEASNLVGRWDFTKDAEDTSGQGNNGTVSGATHTYEQYEFINGVDDVVNTPGSGYLENYTLSVWLKRNNLVSSYKMFAGSNNTGQYFALPGPFANRLTAVYRNSSGTQIFCYSDDTITDNDWHHVAITAKSTGNITFYIDSVKDVPTTCQQPQDYGGFESNIETLACIGNNYGGGYNFNGSIENVYIWNTTLSQEQITEVYRATRLNTQGNIDSFKANFMHGISTQNNYTTWYNLTWTENEPTQTSIAVRYRLANFSDVDTTDANLVSYWRMNRSDATDSFANSSLDTNQVLHMKFNNATDFYDYSGQGNDGTNSGSAYTNVGYIKGARSFDGVNDYVQVLSTFTQIPAAGEFTISLWAKDFTVGTNQGIIVEIYNNSKTYELTRLGLAAGGVAATTLAFYNDYGAFPQIANYPSTGWHHIVATFSSDALDDEAKLYLDGVLKSTDNDVNDIPSSTDIMIATDVQNGFGTYWAKGIFDNIRIYNTSLTAGQVQELYSKEAGTYDEMDRNLGTAENNVGGALGIFQEDGALEFDGVDDYVNCSHGTSLQYGENITVTAWFKYKESGNYDPIIARGVLDNNGFAVTISNTLDEIWIFRNGGAVYWDTNKVVSQNEWHFIAFTKNSADTAKVYFNNDAVLTQNNFDFNTSTGLDVTIGGWFNQFFDGSIDDVAIYNRTLTATEIQDLYYNWSGWSAYQDASPIDLSGNTAKAVEFQALLNTTNNSNTPVFGPTEGARFTPLECGDTVTTSWVLTRNLTCSGTGLYIEGNNIIFNCNNSWIRGNNTADGIKIISSDNVTIENCNIFEFDRDLNIDPGVNIVIQDNNLGNSSNCTVFDRYNVSIARNNTYWNCTDNAIVLYNFSYHNLIYNNTINFSGTGVNIESETNNTVWNNTFLNSVNQHANSIAGNYFNDTIMGNTWDDILNLLIFDTDADGMGDAGSEYPYNSSNNANVTGNVSDERPYTTKTPGAFEININLPRNTSIHATNQINVTCNINSSDTTNNLTGIIWTSAGVFVMQNSTNPATPNITQSWIMTIPDGNYTAGCYAANILGQTNYSQNHTFQVDTTSPSIDFVIPTTSAGNHSQNWISANVTSNGSVSGLQNITIELFNSTRNRINFSNGTTSPVYINFTLLPDGIYYLNATAFDNANNSNSTATRIITLDITPPSINFTSPTTSTGCHNQSWISANVTSNASVSGLQNITIELFNSTRDRINFSNGTTSPVYINFTALADMYYYLNATAYDNANNSNSTETRTIILDTTPPNIVLNAPIGGVWVTNPITFSYTLTDTSPSNCSLLVDGVLINTSTNITSGQHIFIQTLSGGTHTWNVTCTDCVGFTNTSITATISVAVPINIGGGGGGGGGNIQGSYDIEIKELLCTGERTQGTIRNNLGQAMEGQVEIQYKEQTGWTIFQKLTMKDGKFTFTPTKAGAYNIKYQQKNKIVTAQNCAKKETPFSLMLKKEQQKPKKKETFEPVLTETPKEMPKQVTTKITGEAISQIKMVIKYKPELIVLVMVLLVLIYELIKTRKD